MDAKPKLLIVVTLVAILSACAIPWRTMQEPPPAAAPAPAASPTAAGESGKPRIQVPAKRKRPRRLRRAAALS